MKALWICLAMLPFGLLVEGSEVIPNQNMELWLKKPEGESTRTIVFLHGAKPEGLKSISPGCFRHWLEKGYSVAAVSMPGFGKTSGRQDFCGPNTMQFLHLAVDCIKEQLNTSRLAIIGFGQGGLAGILLSTQRSDINGIICSNGVYDLFRHKAKLTDKDFLMDVEDDEALRMRSPLYHISKMSAPLFLLHRENNPCISHLEAADFCNAMHDAGKDCHLVIREKTVDSHEQRISYEEILLEAEDWLESLMK